MQQDGIPYTIEPMRVEDITRVMEIERRSFPTPWSPAAYRHELRYNPHAHYLVIRLGREISASAESEDRNWRLRLQQLFTPQSPATGPIVGYVGFWLVAGEAHISTIAVHPDARRRGLGELLLSRVIDFALEKEAEFVTLEVRESNTAAQRLYEKYGFQQMGRRKRYYTDTREDALIMTLEPLDDAEVQALLEGNRRDLRAKLLGKEPHQ
jgi:ribosomal-protein-alanine N-acetyltransferase